MTDLDALDRYLSSDDSPDECLLVSDLDGFLTALACTPSDIPESEWMDAALGGEVPHHIRELVRERLAEIRQSFLDGQLEPVFWQAKEGHVIAMDWCEGFMEGVQLDPLAWKQLSDSQDGSKLMLPILVHLLDDHGNSVLGIPQEELDETLDHAADAIPDAVLGLFAWFRIG